MQRLTQEHIDWAQKVIQQQQAISKAIAKNIERLFYTRMRKYRDRGQSTASAAQSAIDEMNRDPWGRKDS